MSLTQLFVRTQLRIESFFKDKEAASAIEYVLIAAMVSVVIVLFVTPLGNAVMATLNKVIVSLGGAEVSRGP